MPFITGYRFADIDAATSFHDSFHCTPSFFSRQFSRLATLAAFTIESFAGSHIASLPLHYLFSACRLIYAELFLRRLIEEDAFSYFHAA